MSRVHAQNLMGHLVLSDAQDAYFYLDPDGMQVIALGTREDALAHLKGEEAKELWSGGKLVDAARQKFGDPPQGCVFTLKPHAMVEGRYDIDEVCILPLDELIRFSGDVARQIHDLPDGSQIQFEVTD